VIGTGAHGKLPVMPEVRSKAERKRIKLLILPTIEAIEVLKPKPERHECDPACHLLKATARFDCTIIGHLTLRLNVA